MPSFQAPVDVDFTDIGLGMLALVDASPDLQKVRRSKTILAHQLKQLETL